MDNYDDFHCKECYVGLKMSAFVSFKRGHLCELKMYALKKSGFICQLKGVCNCFVCFGVRM